jgi:hypothetical protein
MTEANLLASARVAFLEPAPADGTVQPLSLNQDGRLRVSSKPGTFPVVAADLVLVNDVLKFDVSDASNVVVHVKNTGAGAMAAGAFIFEGSIDSTDGLNGTWFGMQASRSNANVIEGATGTVALAAAAGMAYSWELSVNAVKWFRVRCTTAVTATSIAHWTAILGSYATEPLPNIPTHAVTVSSGSINVASDTPAIGLSYMLNTAATTNAQSVKATAANLFELSVFNPTAAAMYLKFYSKATAPTVGTDVPVLTVPVPAGALVVYEFGALGKRINVGLALAVTGAAADADTTVVGAGAHISLTYV